MLRQLIIIPFLIISSTVNVEAQITGNGMTRSAEESRIFHELFNEATSKSLFWVRPPSLADNKPLTLKVSLSMVDLISVDEDEGQIEIVLWIYMMWQDPRLVWSMNSTNENQMVKSLHVPLNLIWSPDLTSYDALHLSLERDQDATHGLRALVTMDGTVAYVPRQRFKIKCDFDLASFPHDTANCRLKLGSWTYNGHEVNITHAFESTQNSEKLNITDVRQHSDWSVTAKYYRSELYYPCCPEPYPDLQLEVVLTRKATFFIEAYVTAPLMLLLTLPWIHLLPPDNPTKINVAVISCIGVIISVATFVSNIPSTITPGNRPMMLTELLYTLMLFILSIVISCITASIAHSKHTTYRIHSCFRKLLESCLVQRFCCLGSNNKNYETIAQHDLNRHEDQEEIIHNDALASHHKKPGDGIETVVKLLMENENRRQLEREWYQIALIIDRFTAITFVFFFIITAFVTTG